MIQTVCPLQLTGSSLLQPVPRPATSDSQLSYASAHFYLYVAISFFHRLDGGLLRDIFAKIVFEHVIFVPAKCPEDCNLLILVSYNTK